MATTYSYANTMLQALMKDAYVGLSTTEPNLNGGGITEPSSEFGYTRIAASKGEFAASNGSITNNEYLYFNEASESWETVKYICIFDGPQDSAKCRYYGALSAETTVDANTVPIFRPQSITIQITS